MDRTRRTLARDSSQRARRWVAEARAGTLEPWRLERAAYLGLASALDAARGLGLDVRRAPWPQTRWEDALPWLHARTPGELASLGQLKRARSTKTLRAAAARLLLEPPARAPTATEPQVAFPLRVWSPAPGQPLGEFLCATLLHDQGAFRWDEADDLPWLRWVWRLVDAEGVSEEWLSGLKFEHTERALLVQRTPRRLMLIHTSAGPRVVAHALLSEGVLGHRPDPHTAQRWSLLGFPRRAIRHAQTSSGSKRPSEPHVVHTVLGECWRILGDAQRAEAHFSQGLEDTPAPYLLLRRAELLLQDDRAAEAEPDLDRALNGAESSRLRPVLLLVRGRLHARLGRFERALSDFDEALRLGNSRERVEVLCERAALHRRAGSTALANANVEAALQREPEYPPAWLEHARIARAHGDLAQALRSYGEALAATRVHHPTRHDDPGADAPHAHAHWERAWLLLDQGDELGALADLQRALVLDHRLPTPERPRPTSVQRLLQGL